MKQKTTLFKTILAATMMLGGASLADAQTTLYYRTLTGTEEGATQWSASDLGTGKWVDSGDATYTSNSSGLKVDASSQTAKKLYSLTNSNLFSFSEDAILIYDIVWNVGNPKGASGYSVNSLLITDQIRITASPGDRYADNTKWVTNDNDKNSVVQIGGKSGSETVIPSANTSSILYDVWTIHVEINKFTNQVVALTLNGTNDLGSGVKATFTLSESYTLSSTPDYNYIQVAAYHGKNNASSASGLYTTLESVKITAPKAGYRLIYRTDVDDPETTVKTTDMTDSENHVYLGTTINSEESFYVDDVKYVPAADATTSFVIESGSNDCIVKVREADKYRAVIRAIDVNSSVLDENIATGESLYEGESSYVYYPKAIKVDGIWYITTASLGMETSNEGPYDVTYTATNIEYYADVENMTNNDKFAGGTSGYTNRKVTYSQGRGERFYKTGYVMTDALSGGIYSVTLNAGANSAGNTDLYIVDSEETKITTYFPDWSASTYASAKTITNIEIPKGAKLKIKNPSDGSSALIYDYVYLEKTAEIISSVDALGYTFSSPVPLDFSGTSVRAYIATYDSENDVMRLTNKTKIPANTGVLIFSNSALTNQSIPVTSESTDDVTSNKLMAVSSAMTLNAAEGDNENYVLAIEGGKAVFQLVKTNSASMSAGQAYLQIPKRTSDARSLRIVFDDETTGVADVRGKMEDVRGDFFNLQGQRVDTPKKGLYIVNGKKVVIK